MFKILLNALAIFTIGNIVMGCGSENPFSRGPKVLVDANEPASPTGTISFENDIIPLLSDCVGCHRSGAGGWTYGGEDNAYQEALSVVNTNSPETSSLLVKGSGGNAHGGGTVYSSSSVQYETILLWIEQGANDN